jgi:orotidine-5'-phosphate decarboxylase
VRLATALPQECGLVVTPGPLAGPGPAVVAALAPLGRVMVLAGLHGDPGDAAVAARRYVDFGASMVSVLADGGTPVVEAAVAEITGDRVLAITVWPGADEAEVSASRLGASRGRAVSKIAALAHAAGAGAVLCESADLGVVDQVAPGMGRIVWGVASPEAAGDAYARGAAGVVVDLPAGSSRDPAAAIGRFLTTAPGG